MQGSLVYAVQVIIFVFLFMRYLFGVFIKKFPKSDRVECLGASLITSFMVTCMISAISMCYLESIYLNAWFLFWFVNFSMGVVAAHFVIRVTEVLSKILDEPIKNEKIDNT